MGSIIRGDQSVGGSLKGSIIRMIIKGINHYGDQSLWDQSLKGSTIKGINHLGINH